MTLSFLLAHAHLAAAHAHLAVSQVAGWFRAAAIPPPPGPTSPGGGGGLIGCGDNTLNPCAQAPEPVQQVASTLIMWTRWTGLASGVFGLMSCGVMMAIGRRNRSHLAGEGASGIPWVLGGLSVIALSYGVVSQVLS